MLFTAFFFQNSQGESVHIWFVAVLVMFVVLVVVVVVLVVVVVVVVVVESCTTPQHSPAWTT